VVTGRPGLLAGRTVLVTGAAGGLGRAHALTIAAEEGRVVVVDRPESASTAEETATAVREAGGEAIVALADVRDHEAVDRAAAEVVRLWGRLDGVVANAGVTSPRSALWELATEEWSRVLDVNLTGVFHTCRATVPHLIAAGPGAALVLVASTAAVAPLPGIGAYNASKAGVLALSGTLANELGPYGVRCNAVLPGSVETPMTDEIAAWSGSTRADVLDAYLPRQLLPTIIQPGDVSAAVTWLLAARAVTGTAVRVDAGLTARTGAHATPMRNEETR
jgi:(+)-trans-carveol dehydrogenase